MGYIKSEKVAVDIKGDLVNHKDIKPKEFEFEDMPSNKFYEDVDIFEGSILYGEYEKTFNENNILKEITFKNAKITLVNNGGNYMIATYNKKE